MDLRQPSMLFDLQPGERLQVAGGVLVEYVHKSGRLARLRVSAPRDVKVEKAPPVVLQVASPR